MHQMTVMAIQNDASVSVGKRVRFIYYLFTEVFSGWRTYFSEVATLLCSTTDRMNSIRR